VNALSFLCVMLSELCSIAGQIFFKIAMGDENETGGDSDGGTAKTKKSRKKFLSIFLAGIAVMAVGFFLWVGLMSRFDLSYLYPFDGLNRIVLVFAATIFLKEKPTPSLWLGVILISLGVALVSAS